MSGAQPDLATRAAELRATFDAGFATPARLDQGATVDLLSIRLENEAYALRLSEIAGLVAGHAVTPLPAEMSGLFGIAGFRGSIMPVYDLAALLGHAPAAACRWLAIARAAPVALAFATLEGHLRVPSDAIVPDHDASDPTQRIVEFLRRPDRASPIVDIALLLDRISQQPR